jgi:hypothetical protein
MTDIGHLARTLALGLRRQHSLVHGVKRAGRVGTNGAFEGPACAQQRLERAQRHGDLFPTLRRRFLRHLRLSEDAARPHEHQYDGAGNVHW